MFVNATYCVIDDATCNKWYNNVILEKLPVADIDYFKVCLKVKVDNFQCKILRN